MATKPYELGPAVYSEDDADSPKEEDTRENEDVVTQKQQPTVSPTDQQTLAEGHSISESLESGAVRARAHSRGRPRGRPLGRPRCRPFGISTYSATRMTTALPQSLLETDGTGDIPMRGLKGGIRGRGVRVRGHERVRSGLGVISASNVGRSYLALEFVMLNPRACGQLLHWYIKFLQFFTRDHLSLPYLAPCDPGEAVPLDVDPCPTAT